MLPLEPIGQFCGVLLAFWVSKWLARRIFDVARRLTSRHHHTKLPVRLHYAEVLLVLVFSISMSQYRTKGDVDWITDSFRFVEAQTLDSLLALARTPFSQFAPRASDSNVEPGSDRTQLLSSDKLESVSLIGGVVKVTGGDTMTIRDNQGRDHIIRFHAVDAPERDQPYGREATQALRSLVSRKTVGIDVRDTDEYGRTVGVVYLGGQNVNLVMVCRGHAWWYRQEAPLDADLRKCESDARDQSRGLWAAADPIPPWDWRRGVR